jgi:hypothetical protein
VLSTAGLLSVWLESKYRVIDSEDVCEFTPGPAFLMGDAMMHTRKPAYRQVRVREHEDG